MLDLIGNEISFEVSVDRIDYVNFESLQNQLKNKAEKVDTLTGNTIDITKFSIILLQAKVAAIKKLVTKNLTREALSELNALFPDKTAPILSRFNRIMQENREGLIRYHEFDEIRNRINNAIFDILSNFQS